MRILFLDDNPNRHRQFLMQTIGCIVTQVWTARECIDAFLANEPFDLVCLDHDLGGKTYQEEKENSGTEVAEWIRHKLPKDKYPKKIIIHSWNPQGADRMYGHISLTGIPVKKIPFSAGSE